MAVLRESPWYQEIRQEGEQVGEERGILRGTSEGALKEAQSLILRQLTRRTSEVLQLYKPRFKLCLSLNLRLWVMRCWIFRNPQT